MPKADLAILAPAFLAVAAGALGDVGRREVSPATESRLELRSGRELRCEVAAWCGSFVEGSCGTHRWEDLRPADAWRLLRSIVPAKDSEAAADAAAVVLSLPDADAQGRAAVEWARRSGASEERLAAARAESDALRRARLERARKAEDARLSAESPESGTFPASRWADLSDADFAKASATSVEAARAMLARIGSSATLFETPRVALLSEGDGEASRSDAAALEHFVETWTARLAEAGIDVALQGRIPVIVVADVDRWRALVASSFGGDPSVHRDVAVVYAPQAPGAAPQATVLVAPESDRARHRYAASVGVARALLHYAGTPERPPAWINEGLPRTMADVSVPEAGMDGVLRKPALRAIRAGVPVVPVLAARYGEPIWSDERERATSTSYLFTRWLWERDWRRTLAFAKKPVAGEPAEARFGRILGTPLAAAARSAQRWFMTND